MKINEHIFSFGIQNFKKIHIYICKYIRAFIIKDTKVHISYKKNHVHENIKLFLNYGI